jgi:hypothetical protein
MLHEACRSALPAPRGNIESVTFSGDGQPEAVLGARVSSNFLDILGMRPILGRSFLAEEDKTGGTPVVMVSADFWRRRFNADLQVIGLRSPDSTDTPFTEILTRFAKKPTSATARRVFWAPTSRDFRCALAEVCE